MRPALSASLLLCLGLPVAAQQVQQPKAGILRPWEMEVGQVGKLPNANKVGKSFTNGLEVVQVVDESNALLKWFGNISGQTPRPFWVSGLDTSKLTDGQKLEGVGGVWKVTGTKAYHTAGGAKRTVLLLEPAPSDK